MEPSIRSRRVVSNGGQHLSAAHDLTCVMKCFLPHLHYYNEKFAAEFLKKLLHEYKIRVPYLCRFCHGKF